eukprot:226652-Karenia_brevis.AAC.1
MRNTAHVIPVDITPEPEFANVMTITGATGSATVFAGKNVNPDKIMMLPITGSVPVPDTFNPPPSTPSKIE